MKCQGIRTGSGMSHLSHIAYLAYNVIYVYSVYVFKAFTNYNLTLIMIIIMHLPQGGVKAALNIKNNHQAVPHCLGYTVQSIHDKKNKHYYLEIVFVCQIYEMQNICLF